MLEVCMYPPYSKIMEATEEEMDELAYKMAMFFYNLYREEELEEGKKARFVL